MQRPSLLTKPMSSTYMSSVDQIVLWIKLPQDKIFPLGFPGGSLVKNLPANALISHTSKVMLKILQASLQQHMNHELPDVQAGFRKGRGTRDQIVNICWIIKKAREF